MRKIPLPRVVKDTVDAMQAGTPHLQAANAKQEKIIALTRELAGEHGSHLPADKRAALQAQIDELREEVRREKEQLHRTMDDLKARHPRWID